MSSSYPLLIDRGKKIKRYQYRSHSTMNGKTPYERLLDKIG